MYFIGRTYYVCRRVYATESSHVYTNYHAEQIGLLEASQAMKVVMAIKFSPLFVVVQRPPSGDFCAIHECNRLRKVYHETLCCTSSRLLRPLNRCKGIL